MLLKNTDISYIYTKKTGKTKSQEFFVDLTEDNFKLKKDAKMKDYIEQAIRTAAINPSIKTRLENEEVINLLHAAIGLATESGELLDMLKKHIFYGQPLDYVNAKEELGDLNWYMALAMDAMGTTFDEVQRLNIEKLKARYPEKFDEDKAINRDLDKERKILEK